MILTMRINDKQAKQITCELGATELVPGKIYMHKKTGQFASNGLSRYSRTSKVKNIYPILQKVLSEEFIAYAEVNSKNQFNLEVLNKNIEYFNQKIEKANKESLIHKIIRTIRHKTYQPRYQLLQTLDAPIQRPQLSMSLLEIKVIRDALKQEPTKKDLEEYFNDLLNIISKNNDFIYEEAMELADVYLDFCKDKGIRMDFPMETYDQLIKARHLSQADSKLAQRLMMETNRISNAIQ